eukprot:SAG31_NODE_9868_length_1219_cov_0.992857_2_plen_194_part_01
MGSCEVHSGQEIHISAGSVPRNWNGTFATEVNSMLTLHALKFTDLFSPRFGAVAINNGSMVMVSCHVLRATTRGTGGALVNRPGASLVIRDTVFEENKAMFGGAVFNHDGNIHIEDSRFIGNLALKAGGAVAAGKMSALTIVNTDFIDNKSNGDGKATDSLGDAIIWAGHDPTNCAQNTSHCWSNKLRLNLSG